MLGSVLFASRSRVASCRLALSLCFILPIQTLNSQTPGISGVNVVIRRITSDQGLSDNTVWAITQDKQGFVWFGTSNGLNRYDGKRCVIYNHRADSSSLSDDRVWSLYADTDGSIWVGTNSGLNRFDPSTRTFKKYFHDPGDPTSLSGNSVTSIYRDRTGVLWVGTNWGLNRFEKSTRTWTQFLPTPHDSTRQGDNFISAILEDKHGRLWIGTGTYLQGGGDLYQFDRGNEAFSRFDYSDSSEAKAWNIDWVTSLFEDNSGNLWICSNYRGVYKLDEVSLTHTFVGFYRSSAKGIRVDGTGHPWIATWGPGLFRCEQRTGTYTRYASDAGGSSRISSSRINSIFLDKAGLLWVGTEEGGVNTVSTKPFLIRQKLGDSLQIGNRIDDLLVDKDGRLWIAATEFGVFRFDPRTQQSTRMSDSPVDRMFQDKAGAIWCSTHPFVLRFDSSRNTFTTVWTIPGYGGEDTYALCVDSEGRLWAGTNWGVYRIEKSMKKYTYFVHDPKDPRSITGGEVTAIFNDNSGKIWVGTTEGVNRFEKEFQSFTHFNYDKRDSSSVSDNSCSGIWEDGSGTLWISTGHGLYRFNETSSMFTRVLDRALGQIAQDRKGRFWFSSKGRKLSMFNPADGSLKEFGVSDGLEDVAVRREGHCAILKGGELLFCTTNGLLVFNPDSVRTLTYVPPVVITGINRFNSPVNLSTSPELLREMTFKHGENVFTIEYAALSYDMSEYNQYAYTLEGFDKDWVYCGNRQEATYTNLEPGTYTFRVKGSNNDGIWNEKGTSIAVIITPPFWKTWWFRTFGVLAILLSVGGSIRYIEMKKLKRRIEQLEHEQALERERTRISQDMHDEVGSSLSEIAILSELAKKKPEESEAHVQEISDLASEVIDNVSEIVWAMNPQNDTLDNLVAHVRRYAVKYLSLTGTECKFSVPDTIPAYHLSAEMRRNLFLVVKEALHNVVKHASASEVSITVTISGKALTVLINDNGKGFTIVDHATSGNGLTNMKRRAESIGGNLTIASEPGHGTRLKVAITLPV